MCHLFISATNNKKLKLGIMMVILILLISIIPVVMFFGSSGKFMFVNLDYSKSLHSSPTIESSVPDHFRSSFKKHPSS